MKNILPIVSFSLAAIATPKTIQAKPILPPALERQMQAITNAANIVNGNTQEVKTQTQSSKRSAQSALNSQMQAITNAADIVNGNTQEVQSNSESTSKTQSSVKAIRAISSIQESFDRILKPLLKDNINQI